MVMVTDLRLCRSSGPDDARNAARPVWRVIYLKPKVHTKTHLIKVATNTTCHLKHQPLMRHERARTVKETSCGLIRHTAKMLKQKSVNASSS